MNLSYWIRNHIRLKSGIWTRKTRLDPQHWLNLYCITWHQIIWPSQLPPNYISCPLSATSLQHWTELHYDCIVTVGLGKWIRYFFFACRHTVHGGSFLQSQQSRAGDPDPIGTVRTFLPVSGQIRAFLLDPDHEFSPHIRTWGRRWFMVENKSIFNHSRE
jgi:hypothetical protein